MTKPPKYQFFIILCLIFYLCINFNLSHIIIILPTLFKSKFKKDRYENNSNYGTKV